MTTRRPRVYTDNQEVAALLFDYEVFAGGLSKFPAVIQPGGFVGRGRAARVGSGPQLLLAQLVTQAGPAELDVLTEGCLTRQIPQLRNGVMLAGSQHSGGWGCSGEAGDAWGGREEPCHPWPVRTAA